MCLGPHASCKQHLLICNEKKNRVAQKKTQNRKAQRSALRPNDTLPTLPDAVMLLAIIALATLFCVAASVRVSAVRFAAHIPLAAVWVILGFVKVAACNATGGCYRRENNEFTC